MNRTLRRYPFAIILLGGLVLFFFICCACLLIGIGGWFVLSPETRLFQRVFQPTTTPNRIYPVVPNAFATLRPTSTGTRVQVSPETLDVLKNMPILASDLISLAERLEGKKDIPPSLEPPAAPLEVGDRSPFWVLDSDNNRFFQVQATLRYVTDHGYFWIEDSVPYKEKELEALARTFEEKIYPTNREFFGSEWRPGVDGDPHLYILYTRGLGKQVAGYFPSTDEYPPQAHEYSNAHEMFIFNADLTRLDEEYTYGTLAHEFEHMIHWYQDRNEELWLNEGFADLAMLLNGYNVGGTDMVFASDPDIQLNDWPQEEDDQFAHYGAAFLFTTYFLDRFGEDLTKAVVANPDNGLYSIDEVLAQGGVKDPQTGQLITADDVFVDWTVANYLQEERAGDGRYTYHNYPGAPRLGETEDIRTCPSQQDVRTVSQYGADYIRISCPGKFTLSFAGSQQVNLLPTDPHSGSYAFWSNKGDESDMTLTREFDFTNHSGPLTFEYWTWYDLEKDYDYVYLEASEDGKTWQILETPSGTTQNPTGDNFGSAYNAESGGADSPRWIQESVDLSQFAGKKVFLRFEYITDAGVNAEGFLLDDVSIPELGYLSDFEIDAGGWEAEGFARVQNSLPQSFRLTLVQQGKTTTVLALMLAPDNTLEIPLEIGGDVNEVTLVVSGVTRFTRQKAIYQITIQP